MSRIALAHIHAAGNEAGIDHSHLHNWAVSLGHDSLKDMEDRELDDMARRIKADPYVMAAIFDQFEPIPFDPMAATENAEPGESSLFTPDQWADLHAAADRIQDRFRGDGVR